jgi:hypothetical protein
MTITEKDQPTKETRDALRARLVEVLKSHAIGLSVESCGCCNSPNVAFSYKGEEIFDLDGMNFYT